MQISGFGISAHEQNENKSTLNSLNAQCVFPSFIRCAQTSSNPIVIIMKTNRMQKDTDMQ